MRRFASSINIGPFQYFINYIVTIPLWEIVKTHTTLVHATVHILQTMAAKHMSHWEEDNR